jgi:leucokinin receptor
MMFRFDPELETFLSSNRLYDVPVSLVVFLSIAYGAVSLAAVIGNSAVLWFVVRSHRLRIVTNIFIANLAIADILIGALAIPFQFVAALLQRWILPHFMCAFCTFIQIVSVNVSIFTLAAIAADRYLIVSHLLHFRINKKRARRILVLIWVIAVIAASPAAIALRVALVPDVDQKALDLIMMQHSEAGEAVSLNVSLPYKYQCDNRGLDPQVWKWYNRILVIIQYIVPVCVLIFAYGNMGLQLRDSSSPAVPEKQHSEHYPSQEASHDHRSPSEIELSNHSAANRLGTSASSQKTVMTATTVTEGKETRALSLPANADYIATNKRRVSCITRYTRLTHFPCTHPSVRFALTENTCYHNCMRSPTHNRLLEAETLFQMKVCRHSGREK